jgi:hypothetical protein
LWAQIEIMSTDAVTLGRYIHGAPATASVCVAHRRRAIDLASATIPSSGWRTPVSLLAVMTLTIAVSSLSASCRASRSSTPSASTSTTRTLTLSKSRAILCAASLTAWCSIALMTISERSWLRRCAWVTPATARSHDSVPPPVKMTPPGLAPDEGRDLVTRLFDGASRVARRLVAARGIAHDAVLPRRHGLGHFVTTWCRRRVIEVVLRRHAT